MMRFELLVARAVDGGHLSSSHACQSSSMGDWYEAML